MRLIHPSRFASDRDRRIPLLSLSALLLPCIAVLAGVSPMYAATLTWDANAGTAGAQDGGGTWSSGGPNWRDTDTATDNQTFTNGDLVTFGAGSGAADTVTISGTVTTDSVTFVAPGSGNYTIAGGGTPRLNLSAGATIDVATGQSPTINAQLMGSNGFVKTGGGQLTLGNNNTATFSGGIILSRGTLRLNNNGAAGTGLITINDANTGANNTELQLGTGDVVNSITIANAGSGATAITLTGGSSSGLGTAGTTVWTFNKPTTISAPNLSDFFTLDLAFAGAATVTIGDTNNQRLILSPGPPGASSTFTGDFIIAHSDAIFVARGRNLTSLTGNNVTVNSGRFRVQFDTTSIGGLFGSGIVDSANTAGTLSVGKNNASGSFSGTMQNAGVALSFTKVGTGTQILSGTNTYTGATTISAGVLEVTTSAGALPGGTLGVIGAGSNLQFDGGVLGLGQGNFTRALGIGAGSGVAAAQVQWLDGASGGFAAYGANRSVNLGGASATMTWNSTANFLTTGALILGAGDATHTVDFQNPINFNAAARTVQVNNGSAAVDAILSGALSGGGSSGLTKTGLGTLRLTATNSYAGATNVNGGTLVQDGAYTGGGDFIVNNGGTLKGSGTANGNLIVNAGGTVAPGNSIESLGGYASFSYDGGTFEYEINTDEPDFSIAADLLYGDAGSTLTLLSNPLLTLVDLGSNSVVPLGTKFTLIAYDGTWNGGTFAGYADDSVFTFAGNNWLINYDDLEPGSNFLGDATLNGVVFVTMTAVPEPETFVLAALGLAGVGLVAWRRKRFGI